jgi:hypothetical protein
MPTYPVKHIETGETKELSMTMVEYVNWKEENPKWDKDWSQGCAGIGEVGDWKNKLISRKPGWNEVLDRSSRVPGSRVKKI